MLLFVAYTRVRHGASRRVAQHFRISCNEPVVLRSGSCSKTPACLDQRSASDAGNIIPVIVAFAAYAVGKLRLAACRSAVCSWMLNGAMQFLSAGIASQLGVLHLYLTIFWQSGLWYINKASSEGAAFAGNILSTPWCLLLGVHESIQHTGQAVVQVQACSPVAI